MSKIVAPKSTNVNATSTETKEKKPKAEKPGLESHKLALRLLEGALTEASEANDTAAVKLITGYVKNMHYRMRPWARISYGDE